MKNNGNILALTIGIIFLTLLSCQHNEHIDLTDRRLEEIALRADTVREKISHGDSLLISQACRMTPLPTMHADPLIMYLPYQDILSRSDSNYSLNPYKLFPILFYEAIHYGSMVDLDRNKMKKFHYLLSDFTISKIRSSKEYFSEEDMTTLEHKFLTSIRKFYPEYESSAVYPYQNGLRPYATVNTRPTSLDSLRIYSLNGNQQALDSLNSILRRKNRIEEIAFIYYFKAFAEDDPDLLVSSGQIMYELSARYPNALSVAFDFLKEGEKMNSHKCIQALEKWQNHIDSISTSMGQ